MLKKIITSFVLLKLATLAHAAGPSFCSTPTLTPNAQNSCISTCAALAAQQLSADSLLSRGSYGFCEGVATAKVVKIYKIELGRTALNDPNRCTVWEGEMTINIGGLGGRTQGSSRPIDLRNCPKGVTYDAYFITVGRSEYLTGHSVFPDGSGKIVRTTSTYAGSDLNSNSNFLDNGFTDPAKYYMRPGTGWAAAFKKLGFAPSNDDLSSASSVEMEWDEIKSSYSWATDSTSRVGFRCNPSELNDCVGEISGYADRYATIMPIATPIVLTENDETMQLAWVRFASNRGGSDSVGIRFVWLNDGGTLKYAAVISSSDQGYFAIRNRGKIKKD